MQRGWVPDHLESARDRGGSQGLADRSEVQFPPDKQLHRGHGHGGVGPLVAAQHLETQVRVATVETEDVERFRTWIGEHHQLLAQEMTLGVQVERRYPSARP